MKSKTQQPILKISKELASTISHLHSKIGALEWSGILYYTIDSGNKEDWGTLELTAHKICLMNVGTAIYTAFEYDALIMSDFLDANPEVLEQDMRMGLIHTHHNMSAFFSDTDTDELKDNAEQYDFYLSLVVNFNGKYCAKLATACNEIEIPIVYNNGMTRVKKIKDILTIDCTIEIENHVDDLILQQLFAIRPKFPIHESHTPPNYTNPSKVQYPPSTIASPHTIHNNKEWKDDDEELAMITQEDILIEFFAASISNGHAFDMQSLSEMIAVERFPFDGKSFKESLEEYPVDSWNKKEVIEFWEELCNENKCINYLRQEVIAFLNNYVGN